jgi:hypothetical protein
MDCRKSREAWLIVTLTLARPRHFSLGLDSFLGEAPILLFTLIGGVVADRPRCASHDVVSQSSEWRRRSRSG